MSDDFERFLKSNFFGNPFNAWHDGLQTPLLIALQGDERTQAEDMLLNALPDSRAIVGLGELRSQRAVEPLRKLIPIASVSTEAAVALFKINGDASGLDSVIETLLKRGGHWDSRMNAAIALRNFRVEKAVNALLAALDDPHNLVRCHAAQSLLVMYGQVTERDLLIPPKLSIRIMRDSDRAATAEELRKMVKTGTLKES